MDEIGLTDKENAKKWYDGFTFGYTTDIYNPWSITNYLDGGRLQTYWANTSSNGLIAKLLGEGDIELKEDFQTLILGGTIHTPMDEQIVFDQLDGENAAIWSLLVASGYLRIVSYTDQPDDYDSGPLYELTITNGETHRMFRTLIRVQ